MFASRPRCTAHDAAAGLEAAGARPEILRRGLGADMARVYRPVSPGVGIDVREGAA